MATKLQLLVPSMATKLQLLVPSMATKLHLVRRANLFLLVYT